MATTAVTAVVGAVRRKILELDSVIWKIRLFSAFGALELEEIPLLQVSTAPPFDRRLVTAAPFIIFPMKVFPQPA